MKKPRWVYFTLKESLILAIFLTLTVMQIGCSKLGKTSPSDTVTAVYAAANKGRYSELEKYLSSESKKLMNNFGALGGGTKGIWDRNTKNGSVERIEILNEEIRGEGAKVSFKLYFKDGTTKTNSDSLVKEDGRWKLGL